MSLGHAGLFTVKSLEYPFWAVGHTAYLAYKAARAEKPAQAIAHIPVRLVKKDGVSMVIYATLYAIGRSTMMTLYEMDDATSDGTESEDDLIVYVNGFKPGDEPEDDGIFHDTAASYLEFRHGGRKRSIGIVAKSVEDMQAQLEAIAKQHGKIKKLEFYGHGNEGTIFLQKAAVGESHFTDSGTKKLKGVFASDAKIVLNTCWVSRGKSGTDFQKAIGENFLDAGGSVTASAVTFGGTPNFIADLAAMPFLAIKGGEDAWSYREQKPLLDYLSKEKFTTLKVAPRPVEQTIAKPTY